MDTGRMGWLNTQAKQAICGRETVLEGEKGWIIVHSDRCDCVEVSNVVIDRPLKTYGGQKPKPAERNGVDVGDFVGHVDASAAT